jgi:ribonuclease P protein component
VRTLGVRRVFREGRAVPGEHVVIHLAPGSGDVAVVAGRRIGGAVVRNRARRVMRAALREAAPTGLGSYDAVIVARSSIRSASSRDVAAELRRLLEPEAVIA